MTSKGGPGNLIFGISQTIVITNPAGNRNTYLLNRILPALERMGFNKAFVQTLLMISASAWEPLGRFPENIVHLHPHMRYELDEVRQGLLIQADKKMALDAGPSFMTPKESHDILQQSMDPANLHLLFDDITTPWIILPRAYNQLKRHHVHYFPPYLEMIENETNEEALHIFTRIAIEFLANFSIRFADNAFQKEKIVRLVTAGYTAMFWKNLHTPPKGFEDVRIFEHFYTWLKHSGNRLESSIGEVAAVLREMGEKRSHIFPSKYDTGSDHNDRPDTSRFLVALRHGCLGIVCSVRSFWVAPSITRLGKGAGTEWRTILFSLNALSDLLACRYGSESKRTQYFIREFLFQLKTLYSQTSFHTTGLDSQFKTTWRFVQARIIKMINQLERYISAS